MKSSFTGAKVVELATSNMPAANGRRCALSLESRVRYRSKGANGDTFPACSDPSRQTPKLTASGRTTRTISGHRRRNASEASGMAHMERREASVSKSANGQPRIRRHDDA